ncbi:MAG: cadmium-translocating P-type ATPase [Desulfarculus sp.]|nr:cadmium-translocating P-type ATPase [Pseudomonadota bacterium]MBV1717011.1 cadmium-translocating P-type ATPase [Desulfarculus sp.]MBU4575846.1 cadmium-translocating P-type ATPase [Pseudomonadota bacterium]MBU4597634.1 cadmium-translocating P-type ATPase [Pseudomonadota bacterium]MBV1736587.1 cadmium-translocating P-type ATPase [Desulfarculus sp.]
MKEIQIKQYDVHNLDCATCAAKIERELQKTEGVESATVDFANLTLHLKTTDIPKALATVARVEPRVKLVSKEESPQANNHNHTEATGFRKQVIITSIAGILFAVHLLFENLFHHLPWSWVEYAIIITAYLLAGWSVLVGALSTVRRGQFFDENVLMVIATAGAMAIHALSEAVGVMLFFKIGELLQDVALQKSRRSIRGILAARPERAMVRTEGGYEETTPAQVNIGDIILIKPGEKVPLDGEVVEGSSQVDTSPLTGEPVPVQVRPGDIVMAGTINTASAVTVRVTKLFAASSISRILELVENAASRKAATEKFITTFARYYTPVVVAIAATIAFLPPLILEQAQFSTWIYRSLVLLVISCPCALVVSIPLGYFGGIGRASRDGILIKGSTFIDALSNVKTVIFDKTGTLTRGVFTVDQVVAENDFSADQVLLYASAAERFSTHPIGRSIVEAAKIKNLSVDESLLGEHNILPGRGVRAIYDGKEIIVGNDALLHERQIDHGLCDFESTIAHVVIDGLYAGYVLIGDQIKPDAKQAVEKLRANGVEHLIMLTGDNEHTAAGVAKTLGLDRFYAELLPEDKVRVFDEISAEAHTEGKVAFVGDGINDAPVLARADVGIAMGAFGSDAAIETADVVLMTDTPSKVAEALKIAKHTRLIVWQNIVLALSVKGVFILLGSFGLATMWEAVFADVGTALIALLNATRALRN